MTSATGGHDCVPLVTVVIPCYNQGRFLRDAVDSVLAQTCQPLEIVVVNDGSSDDTVAVAESYGDRLTLITQPNAGAAVARNTGIVAARAPTILFLDADDALDPDCVERRLALLDDDAVGLVAGGLRKADELLVPYPDEAQRVAAPNLARAGLYVRESWTPTCGLLVRKVVFDRCGLFDPLLANTEDWEFQIRATWRYRHVYEPEPRATYRQVPGSYSRNHVATYDSIVCALRKNRAYAPNQVAYAWHALAGWFNQVAGSIFGQVLADRSGFDRVREVAKLVRQRPALLLLVVAWAIRFTFNRIVRVVGVKRA